LDGLSKFLDTDGQYGQAAPDEVALYTQQGLNYTFHVPLKQPLTYITNFSPFFTSIVVAEMLIVWSARFSKNNIINPV